MPRKAKGAGSSVQETNQPTPEEKPASFYALDLNELDRDLSPDQLKEWTNIYASFRSRTPLSGTVIGVDSHSIQLTNPKTGEPETKEILCLVVMDYRVKILIPQTEIWFENEDNYPDYMIRNMVGAKVEYVIISVDREGDCAVGSRKQAMGYRRNRFLRDGRVSVNDIVTVNLLVIGAKRMLVECNGFDISLSQRDISYTAIVDLREEYRPGQEVRARIKELNRDKPSIKLSIKEVNPNPFDGADKRHPVNSRRKAKISGTYGGGVFCRLTDDTNILCLYSPGYFAEEFFINDDVLIMVTRYDYERKLIYGRLLSKW